MLEVRNRNGRVAVDRMGAGRRDFGEDIFALDDVEA